MGQCVTIVLTDPPLCHLTHYHHQDHANKPINYTLDAISESVTMFTVSASPASGDNVIAGMVLLDDSNSADGFSSHISFSLDLDAGEYEITIKYGGIASQHMLGSPFQLSVIAGLTSPATTACELTQFVTAGKKLEARIFPKDLRGFPTNHASDSFSVWIDGSQSSNKANAIQYFNTTTQLSHFLYTKRVTVSGPNCEFAWVGWE